MIKSGHVLVINCGSSSIKFSVIDDETTSPVLRGSVERIGQENAHLKCTAADGMGSQLLGLVDHEGALQSIATVLNARAGLQKRLLAVGHRVVHGGETFCAVLCGRSRRALAKIQYSRLLDFRSVIGLSIHRGTLK